MRAPCRLLGGAVLIAALVIPLSAGPAGAITTTKDVVYKAFTALNGQPDTLALDVYTPGGSIPPSGFPTIFGIHGSRENGDKSSVAAEATILATAGFVVVAPDYRLNCPADNPPPGVDPLYCGYISPTQIGDLEDAVRFMLLPSQVNTYHIDPGRVGAFGTSAGANLAELLGTLDYGVPKFQGVVGLSGETELWLNTRSPNPDRVWPKDIGYIGCTYPGSAACNQLWFDASPQSSLSASDPPMYTGNGKYEEIPLLNAQDTANLATSLGVPNFLRVPPGVAHGSNMEDDVVGPNGTTVMDEAVSFLKTYVMSGPKADLSITGTATPASVSAGANLTYALTVANNGPQFGSGVTVSDTLPGGVTLVSVTPSQGSCAGTTTVTCNLGLIPPPSPATVAIVVTPTGARSLSDSASVTESGPSTDPSSANNSVSLNATAVAQVNADLAISLSDSPDPVTAGHDITYTAVATNMGPGVVNPVTLTDTLPPGVTLVSATPTQGSCSSSTTAAAATSVSCSFGSVASGGKATTTIVATPGVPGTLSDTAAVSGNAVDSVSSNNGATTTTTINNVTGTGYASLLDSGSSPSTVKTTEGAAAQWSLPTSDSLGHSATEDDGFAAPLFDSGVLEPGWFYAYTFFAAGTYTVTDIVTDHIFTVSTALKANPTKGGTTTSFKITWASQTAPTGFAYDVQIRRPGASYVNWQSNSTATNASFVPDAGTGKYQFRARLKATTGGTATRWSPAKKITVS